MWFQKRGLVTSVRESHCIVVTPDGSYEKIPLPSREVQVGEEIEYNRVRIPTELKPVLMAASFLLVFMSFLLMYQANLNQVAAYVTLDINPSLEIAVDRNLTVIDVLCLNEDAARMVKPGDFKGKSLNEVISGVIDKAVEQNYIKPGEENLIVSTVSNVDEGAETINQEDICGILEESAASRGRRVQVKVYTTSDQIHKEARSAGISAGKYVIYEELKKNGKPVRIDDVKKNSVKKMVEKHQVDLPPNYRKFTSDKEKFKGKPAGKDNNGKKHPAKDDNRRKNGDNQKGNDKKNPAKNDSRNETKKGSDNNSKSNSRNDHPNTSNNDSLKNHVHFKDNGDPTTRRWLDRRAAADV